MATNGGWDSRVVAAAMVMVLRLATPADAGPDRICRAACRVEVAACVAGGGRKAACSTQIQRDCKRLGVAVCSTGVTATTTSTTTSSTSTSTRPTTTTTAPSTTTTRPPVTTTTTTSSTTTSTATIASSTTTRAPLTTTTTSASTTTTLPMQLSWVRRIGAGLIDAGSAVAIAADDDRLVAGVVSGTVDFGGGPVSGFESDAFVARYAPEGGLRWARRWGDAGIERVVGLVTDASGNVVVAGTFAGTIDVGTGPLRSVTGADSFVVAFDRAGTPLWANRLAAAVAAVAMRPDGAIVLVGTAVGAVDFGAGPTAAVGGRDLFVAQYAPDGALAWARRFAGSGSVTPRAVAVDATGTVAVSGFFSGSVDLGSGLLPSVGGYDLFVATYGPTGLAGWSRRAGGAGTDDARGIAIDAGGGVVVTGYVQGIADLGGGPLGGSPQSLIVARYGPRGALLWGAAYGATYGATGSGVAVDGDGRILVTGSFQGAGGFGGSPMVSAGLEDIVLGAWSLDGAPLWSLRYGGTLTDRGLAVTADGHGRVVVTGSFDYFVDFGSGPVLTAGNGDVFVLALQ